MLQGNPARKSKGGSSSIGDMINWKPSGGTSSNSGTKESSLEHDQKSQEIIFDSDDSSDEEMLDSGESSTEERPKPRSQTNLRKRPVEKNTKQNVNYKSVPEDASSEVRNNKLALMRFSDIFQREDGKKDDKFNSTDQGDIILDSEPSDEEPEKPVMARPNPTKKQKLSNEKSQPSASSSTHEVAYSPKPSPSVSSNSKTSTVVLLPKSVLFKFVCSCTTVKEIRYALQEDYEDEKHVASRKRHNAKTSARKGRFSSEEIKFIRKYYDMTKDIRFSKFSIPLNNFKDVESLDDGIFRTWENSNEDEVNVPNIKHMVATILGRSFELVTVQWRRFEKKDSVRHRNFVLYLEQMRYHFEESAQLASRHKDHDEEILEIYQSILIHMRKYIEQVNAKRNGHESFDRKEMKKMEETLNDHYNRLEDYLQYYNEELHDALWKCSSKLMK